MSSAVMALVVTRIHCRHGHTAAAAHAARKITDGPETPSQSWFPIKSVPAILSVPLVRPQNIHLHMC